MKPTKRITIDIPPEQIAWLDRKAHAQLLPSRSPWLRQHIAALMEAEATASRQGA